MAIYPAVCPGPERPAGKLLTINSHNLFCFIDSNHLFNKMEISNIQHFSTFNISGKRDPYSTAYIITKEFIINLEGLNPFSRDWDSSSFSEVRRHFSCGKNPCFLSEERDYQHSLPSSLRPVLPRISFISKTGGSPLLCFGSQVRYKSFQSREELGFSWWFCSRDDPCACSYH